MQRSGGTLISQLLDGHSELHVHPHELRIGHPKKHDWPVLDLDAEADALFAVLSEQTPLQHAQEGFKKIGHVEEAANPDYQALMRPFIFHQPLQAEIFRRLVARRRPVTRRQALDAYVTSYFNAWLDYQGLYKGAPRYWAGFVPRLFASLANQDAFAADYPDGRIITPVRDPASWYASARLHSPGYADPEAAIGLWLQANEAILSGLERRPDMILLVEHARVVSDTPGAMQAVARFLGVGFEPALLVPTFNGIPVTSNSSFGARYGVDPASADRSDRLEPEIRGLIESRTAAVQGRLRAAAAAHVARYG